MNKGHIIFLNGVSSSGKTTLSKMLTTKLPNYYHFGVDDFDIIIERMEDRENNRLIPVPTEHFFHSTIKMFSDKGVNLIIDHILHDQNTFMDCFQTLRDYPVLFVGVHCPAEELVKREKERGDRQIGQAKRQLEFVHQQNEKYDVAVDTYTESLDLCSERIIEKLVRFEEAKGWGETYKTIKISSR